jgi:Raf kinase inhibitor-like YbhB/YbcL family protein
LQTPHFKKINKRRMVIHLQRKLKILNVLFIAICFLFTIIFMNGCGPAEPAENTEESETEKTMKETEETTAAATMEEAVETTSEEMDGQTEEEEENEEEVIKEDMKIDSPAFSENEMIPSKYTCDGDDINPPLNITGIPGNAESIVLVVDDPDAPGKTWVHWTVWNIDPAVAEIPENSVPDGAIEGVTDFGTPGYGGPCPPSGTHRYFFKVYALDTTLDLDTSATVKDIEEAIKDKILDSAELVGLYERS